ncbi:MAG: universal stress protein [Deltaproteobacteria bacterium]|nr:universal stress protein [Deltaproteobacteria bacterium]
MQIYKKILVAIDCSDVDEAIISHIALLARQNQAKVYLLHVVHAHSLDQERVLRLKAESRMKTYLKCLRDQGIETFSLLKKGEPEEEILAEIKKGDYDLAAMATHGHGFFGDMLFGSVSDALKHHIDIPLLLLRG